MADVNPTKHRPGAVDHHALAERVISGHAAIANAVQEYADAKAARLEDARALYGAQRAAEATAVPGD